MARLVSRHARSQARAVGERDARALHHDRGCTRRRGGVGARRGSLHIKAPGYEQLVVGPDEAERTPRHRSYVVHPSALLDRTAFCVYAPDSSEAWRQRKIIARTHHSIPAARARQEAPPQTGRGRFYRMTCATAACSRSCACGRQGSQRAALSSRSGAAGCASRGRRRLKPALIAVFGQRNPGVLSKPSGQFASRAGHRRLSGKSP
jgi:hypothetical protein